MRPQDKYNDAGSPERHFNYIRDGCPLCTTVDYAIETVLNKLDGMFSLKKEQTTALKPVLEYECYSSLSAAARFVAVIGVWPIQLRPEAFWSMHVGDALWKSQMNTEFPD